MFLFMAGSFMRTTLTQRQCIKAIAPLTALLLLPDPVYAHLVTTGMGPVYDGIGHLVLTPEDLIPTLALALYCGMRGARAGRYAMFILPLLWFTGGLFGLTLQTPPSFPVSALSFLLLGVLIATDAKLPLQMLAPIIAAVGFMHGILNGLALKSGPGGLALLGIMGALFVLVTLLSAVVVSLKPPWTRIVIRVMGSWIAASGMLMIGWFFRGHIS